jgi:hypothetical protein
MSMAMYGRSSITNGSIGGEKIRAEPRPMNPSGCRVRPTTTAGGIWFVPSARSELVNSTHSRAPGVGLSTSNNRCRPTPANVVPRKKIGSTSNWYIAMSGVWAR